jgi:hypothetical protein
MGIPDHVYIFGPPKSQYRQVGNAICPLVTRLIAERILIDCLGRTLGEVRPSAGSKRGQVEAVFLGEAEFAKRRRVWYS